MVTKVVICYNTLIIFTSVVIIIRLVCCHCGLASVWWVLGHLSWLRLFLSRCILYAINNCSNKSIMFGVNSVSGDWSSFVGGFTFLVVSFIYRLYSIWIIQYALLIITADSQPLLFPIPPGGISYVNPIFTLISVSFSSSSAASSSTPTAASSAFK